MKKNTSLTYASSGVSYATMDPIKRLAQKEAAKTAESLTQLGLLEVAASRGESAYVWREGNHYKAFVVEGLGTKNLVADAMQKITGKSYYQAIAQDTVAMIVNDLIVVGAAPEVINAYFAVGSSEWFADTVRASDLIKGWRKACQIAGATWGGGETPTLKDIIHPEMIDLSGAAVGSIKPKSRLTLGEKLKAGDHIILIESSGIHANGLTLARAIAKKLKDGFATKLPSGKLYGESLLQPTHIYAELVQALFAANVKPHYMINITGHGWRKLMRATQPFTYHLTKTPPVPEIFAFIQDHSHSSDEEMYGNFNMGAGFAVIVSAAQSHSVLDVCKQLKFKAWLAGTVEAGPKKVEINSPQLSKLITFKSDSLGVR